MSKTEGSLFFLVRKALGIAGADAGECCGSRTGGNSEWLARRAAKSLPENHQQRRARVNKTTVGLFGLLVLAAAGCARHAVVPAPSAGGGAIDRVLVARVPATSRSAVLVLGTPHLAAFGERVESRHLEPLLTRLAAFAPTRIAVESLTADEIALLGEWAERLPAAAELLGMYGGRTLQLGRQMQASLGLDRAQAAVRAEALIAALPGEPDQATRLQLVALWLAAYEFDSAALQWSYLDAVSRGHASLVPAEVGERLDRFLARRNETGMLAIALARRLGLQRIWPIDSQYDGVRTLAAPREHLNELFSDPRRGESADLPQREHNAHLTNAALAAGDLLPLYRHHNSPAYLDGDARQWHWFIDNQHPSGLGRFRYAMWELRNLRQATYIVEVAASTRPERVLVVIGSAHKAPLERVLATQLGVELVSFDAIAGGD